MGKFQDAINNTLLGNENCIQNLIWETVNRLPDSLKSELNIEYDEVYNGFIENKDLHEVLLNCFKTDIINIGLNSELNLFMIITKSGFYSFNCISIPNKSNSQNNILAKHNIIYFNSITESLSPSIQMLEDIYQDINQNFDIINKSNLNKNKLKEVINLFNDLL